MSNYTNTVIARGTLVNTKLTKFVANMRIREKMPNGAYRMTEKTVATNCVRGTITLKIGEENQNFRVNLVEREPNFVNGIQQKAHPGYAQVIALEEQEAGTYVELQGFLSDGTFAKNGEVIKGLHWNVSFVTLGREPKKGMCRAAVSAVGLRDYETKSIRIYIAPNRGTQALPLFGNFVCEDSAAIKPLASGETCNLLIERHIKEEEDETGRTTYKRELKLVRCELAEDEGETYGFCRKEYAERSRNARAAYEQKLLDNEYRG